MRIAISVREDKMESTMDTRFGRCPFFYIYDNEEQSGAFHKNPAFDADHGAGLRAAQYVADQGVSLVITGEVGPKASDILNKVNMNIDLRKEEEPLVNILKGIEVG